MLKNVHVYRFLGCLFALAFGKGFSTENTLYVLESGTSQVYATDPKTGQYTILGTFPPAPSYNYNGLSLMNDILYSASDVTGEAIVAMNRSNGTSYVVTSNPNTPIADLAVINNTTAYVLSFDYNIYSVNLQNGQSSLVTASPIIPGPISESQIGNIALNKNNTTAYVSAFNNNVYAVNLQNGSHFSVTPTPLMASGLQGIALASDNLAYVVSADNNVYSVNLTNGQGNLITPIPIPDDPSLYFIIIDPTSNNTIAYAGGFNNGQVYKIDLRTGSFVPFLTPPPHVPPPGFGISSAQGLAYFVFSSILTTGLHGNNLRFAEYINSHAPLTTIQLFDDLQGSELTEALTAAMPARLGFATFAAQNGFLAASQVITDHLNQKRFARPQRKNGNVAAVDLPAEDVVADASESTSVARGLCWKRNKQKPTCPKGFVTGWMAGFGEYAREKSQQQTPAFTAAVGGAVVGMDYNCINDDVIGIGGSYAYTHVHEKQNMGHATVNQGFLGLYSTLHASKVYFDLGVWGGYYHSDNDRKIVFSGFDETAKSSTHGWQAAPHFEFGYDGYFSNVCSMNWFGVGPFLLADWVANWEHSFSEHGAQPLNIHQKGRFCSLLRGETGLRLHEIVSCSWGNLVFQEKGSYAYQKMFNTGRITALLIGSPGSFTVNTLTGAQNLGVVEFSMLFKPTNRSIPYVDLRYQGEFGSRYQSHQGILEIGEDF